MNADCKTLATFIANAETITILTGAGVSTASGIPDYRDRNGDWKHARPVQFADFMGKRQVRRRYWARSYAGWNRMATARPNDAHRAVAKLQQLGHVDTLITQNVDSLHSNAGASEVIDLHGRLNVVCCMSCDSRQPRDAWQQRLLDCNPEWGAHVITAKPDGDSELAGRSEDSFEVPDCEHCGGIIKPDVVFFGEAVPADRVERAREGVSRAGGLLIVGSSLMVFSGLRFARYALEIGTPIAILNQGRTRADDIAQLKLDGDCGEVLKDTVRILDAPRFSTGAAV